MHHTIVTEHQAEDNVIDDYLEFNTAVFEDYVKRSLRRMYPSGNGLIDRVTHIDQQKEKFGKTDQKSCDFAVQERDSLLFIEVKGGLINPLAQQYSDLDHIEEKFDEICFEPAAQIQQTIELFEQGKINIQGLEPADVNTYYPIVMLREKIPFNQVIYSIVSSYLRENDLLQRNDIRPLEFLVPYDLDYLEVAVNAGSTIPELIDEKQKNPRFEQAGIGLFWAHEEKEFLDQTNDYLQNIWDSSVEHASETLWSEH